MKHIIISITVCVFFQLDVNYCFGQKTGTGSFRNIKNENNITVDLPVFINLKEEGKKYEAVLYATQNGELTVGIIDEATKKKINGFGGKKMEFTTPDIRKINYESQLARACSA